MTISPSLLPATSSQSEKYSPVTLAVQRQSRRESRLHVEEDGSPLICKLRKSSSIAPTSIQSAGPTTSCRDDARPPSPNDQKTRRDGFPNSSPFISIHLGEPCSINAVDHILTCGHKVLTMQPEDCASNCARNQPHRNHITTNPRRLDEPFICMACITEQVAANHGKKACSFQEELEVVARGTQRAQSLEWIRDKIAIVEVAWLDLALKEMTARLREGRLVHPFYIDPDFQRLVNEALKRIGPESKCEPKEKAILQAATAVMTPDPIPMVIVSDAIRCDEEANRSSSASPSSRPASRLPVRRR